MLRRSVVIFLVALGITHAEEPAKKAAPVGGMPMPMTVLNFDHDIAGKAPAGLILTMTGVGPQPGWQVTADLHAASKPNVLVQNGSVYVGDVAALAIKEGSNLEHGEISVRFKTSVSDQNETAGLVWRYRDPNTYYLAEISTQDDSCTLYRVKKGKRKLIDTKSVMVSPLTWHELRVVFVNDNFSVLVDRELTLGTTDSSYRSAGAVGLLTQSDGSVQFDDFSVTQ